MIATYGPNKYIDYEALRDGMKTFAATDIAYGQRLDSIVMKFDYYTGADTTGYNMQSPGINFFITDGNGNYGIWSATSDSSAYSDQPIAGTDWTHRILDLTAQTDTDTVGKVYESNDGLGSSRQWSEIKDWTIAGFYDYQRTPEGGFAAWNPTLWSDMTNVGTTDSSLNEFGIVLFHGDTVGGMYGDGEGEIGDDAERPWAQNGRMARNYQISIQQPDDSFVEYDVQFASAPIPLPPSMAMTLMGLVGIGGFGWVRRRRG
jgi:hypothetical protein